MGDSLKRTSQGEADLTGRDRLVCSVLFNWGGHFVFIIAGFIMPRMIDRRLGQNLLGVWDFAWSLVSYFQLIGAGISSSVNRYVARHRAVGDIASVNSTVSSACCIMAVSGVLVLGLTVAASLLLPQTFGARLEENVREAQWVVLFLGASLAVEIAFQAYNGVLTGCHRWGLQNVINGGWHAITIAAMIICLLKGHGLRALSLVYTIGIVLAYGTRMLFAYRVCEGLRIHPSLVRWGMIREQFVFGGKALIPRVSQLLLNQTTNVLIVLYLGPAMLALYARPRSLLLHTNTLVKKMGYVLIPTVSSLQSEGGSRQVRELVTQSVRYSLYMALPIVFVLSIFGGTILRFWMGPRYDNGAIPAILATGFLVTLGQTPVWPILVGLNGHGRAGVAEFIASLFSAALVFLVLGPLKCGLAAVAAAITLPLAIVNVVYIPHLICRKVGLNVKQYFLSVSTGPAIHTLPFAVCLVAARLIFHSSPYLGLAVGSAVGGAFLVIAYWLHVLPERVKGWILRSLYSTLRSARLCLQRR